MTVENVSTPTIELKKGASTATITYDGTNVNISNLNFTISNDISLPSGKTIVYNGLSDWRLVDVDDFESGEEGTGTAIRDMGTALTGSGTVGGATWSTAAAIEQTAPHQFTPAARFVTLNPSNTSADGIDFTDQSTVPISGYARFEGTSCFQKQVEILVNGKSNVPQVFTDADGKFSLDVEPGATVRLSPKFEGHVFSPPFWDLEAVSSPVAGILFRNQTTRRVLGQVAGGHCRRSVIPVGAVVKVKVATLNGCYEQEKLLTGNGGDVLSSLDDPAGALMKSQAQFSNYYGAPINGWLGSLPALNNNSMYQYRADVPDTLALLGALLDPDSVRIPLSIGWNWVSYVPTQAMPVNQALSNLTALDGDLVKSQTEFAQYIAGFGWIGNLKYMAPPQGYLLKAAVPDTLVYPDLGGKPNGSQPPAPAAERGHWSVNPADFEHTMTLVGILDAGGTNVTNAGHELGAFVGSQCRGAAEAIWVEPLSQWMFFMTIYANQLGEKLNFKRFDAASGQTFDLSETRHPITLTHRKLAR